MTKFTNESGEEVDGFTQEELDAKVKEATETQIKESDEVHTKEKEGLEKTISDNKEKMEGLEKKGESVVELREKTEKLEKEAKEKDETHKKEKEELEGKIVDSKKTQIAKDEAQYVKVLAGDDEELGKKIVARTERLKKAEEGEISEERRAEIFKEAYKLEAEEISPDVLGQTLSSSGGGGPDGGTSVVKPELQEMGLKKFGLTSEDFQKAKDKGAI